MYARIAEFLLILTQQTQAIAATGGRMSVLRGTAQYKHPTNDKDHGGEHRSHYKDKVKNQGAEQGEDRKYTEKITKETWLTKESDNLHGLTTKIDGGWPWWGEGEDCNYVAATHVRNMQA